MCAALPESFDPETGVAQPREVDCLMAGADWVVTAESSTGCIRHGAVAIDGDRIAAVGPTDRIESRFTGRTRLDLRGHMLLPGLVNTHTHAAMSCFRGLGSDLPLGRWLNEVIFPAEKEHVSPEMVYWGTLLSCAEMLKNGVTTFCDGYFFEQSAVQAALDAGIRAVLGQGILDFPAPGQPDPSRARDGAEAFLADFPTGEARVRASLFCHAPYTCCADTLGWVKGLCREHGILFQIHLSETRGEVELLTQEHGLRPVFYLDRLGILDSMTLCAHAVWVSQDEIDLLALRKAGVSDNTESNMKLASGVAPVPELLSAGVKVGLGTDGCASNNGLDLFSAMDKVAKVQKAFHRDPVVCPASTVFEMATRGGASILGWDDEIGSLAVGKKADLVAIDLSQPHLTPIYDPVSHLAYTVKGSDVSHVWVGGRQVVGEGRILTWDVREAIRQVNRIASRIKKVTS